jgi:hypothetical protein
MKKLIYENYSQFVFASKTLGEIGGSCDVMMTSLSALSAKLEEIQTIPPPSAPHARLAKISTRFELVSALEYCYNLPLQLKRLLADGKGIQAIALFKSVDLVAFPAIKTECVELVGGLLRKAQRR